MRKIISVFICLITIVPLTLLSACSGSKDSNSTMSQNTQQQQAATEESSTSAATEVKYPIVDKPLTLTYWTYLLPNLSGSVKNMNDIAATKAIEKKTGIHIEFQHPAGDVSQQFNIMLASNDLPDMIEWDTLNGYPGGPEKLIKENMIIGLNDLIAKYAPNLTKLYNDNPEYRKMAMTDNGTLYNFRSFLLTQI